MQYTQLRFDEVLATLDQDRRDVGQNLQRLTKAADYLGSVLAGLNNTPLCGYARPALTARRALQRFAVKLNHTTIASTLALAQEVFSEQQHTLVVRVVQ